MERTVFSNHVGSVEKLMPLTETSKCIVQYISTDGWGAVGWSLASLWSETGSEIAYFHVLNGKKIDKICLYAKWKRYQEQISGENLSETKGDKAKVKQNTVK